MKHRLQTLLKHKLQWLVLLTVLFGVSQGAWAWGFKYANGSWSCNQWEGSVDFYENPQDASPASFAVRMQTNPGTGFSLWQHYEYSGRYCTDGQNLSVSPTDVTSLSSSTIVRAVAKWNGSMYCTHTKIIPGGTIYLTPTGGSPITMEKSTGSYLYSAIVTFPGTLTFSISGETPSGSITDNTSSGFTNINQLALNYTGLTSSYSTAMITYNLETNQVIVSECTNGAPSSEIKEILDGDKIWFYAGIQADWNKSKVYISDQTTDKGNYSIDTKTICSNNDSKIAEVKLPADQYYLSHVEYNGSGWRKQMAATAVAGKTYVLGNSVCSLSGDGVTTQEGTRINTFKFDNSSGNTSKTVDQGDDVTIYVSTVNSVSKSRMGYELEVRYFVKKSGEGYYQECGWVQEVNSSGVSSGTLTTDNLSGTYDVYALLMEQGAGSLAVKATSTLELTVTPPCSKPAASFTTVKAQLNAGGGSPWAGSEATTSSAASDGYFADGHRTITLTETNGTYAYYNWQVSTDNSTWNDISSSNGSSKTYTVNLPGTYYFRCQAGCSSSDYSTSSVMTVNVPYPSMGIEGPGIKGCAAWTPSYASGSGLMSRSELTWSGTVTVNATGTSDGAFIIIQQYKNGVTSGSGWASCTEDGNNACSGTCDGDDIKGNTVNKDCKRNTLTNLDKVSGGNYYFNSDKFAADQQVKITVTMTAYNTYTVTACLIPQSMSINGPLQACVNDQSLTALEVTATATSPSYQWQSCSTADGVYADISGANSYTYTPDKSASAKYYRCAVTACGTTVNSDHKQYTIYGASVAGSIAQKTTGTASPLGICKDATAILKLTGNTGSIQWQKYNSSTSQFENESGETSSEYTTTAKNATGIDYYRAAVTNGVCPTVYTAADMASSYEVESYNPVNAGTVTLTPNEVCVGDLSTAEVSGEYLAGGIGAWSAGSGASIDSDGNIETSSSGTPTITYTISSYKCPGTASANATLTIKYTPSFSINADPASGYTAWKPITLSTSNSANANWSISTDPSPGTAYLNASTGVSSTVFKAPANVSNYTVSATETSDGCDRTATKNITVSSVECE